jgi:hypothetical protein
MGFELKTVVIENSTYGPDSKNYMYVCKKMEYADQNYIDNHEDIIEYLSKEVVEQEIE